MEVPQGSSMVAATKWRSGSAPEPKLLSAGLCGCYGLPGLPLWFWRSEFSSPPVSASSFSPLWTLQFLQWLTQQPLHASTSSFCSRLIPSHRVGVSRKSLPWDTFPFSIKVMVCAHQHATSHRAHTLPSTADRGQCTHMMSQAGAQHSKDKSPCYWLVSHLW